MPDPNPIAGLYPQPPQQPQNALAGNPFQTVGQIQQIQQVQGQRAAGNALVSGMRADGTFDPAAAVAAARGNPNIGYAGAQFTQGVLANRGADIANATNQLGLGVAHNAALSSIIAPYANKEIGPNDEAEIKAKLAAAGVNPQTIAAANINGVVKTANAARTGAIQSMGAAAAAQQTAGAPTAQGAPTATSLGTTVGAGARTIGLPPGQAEAATGLAASSAAQATDLGKAADSSPVRKGMLGNLESDLNQFTSGQGADWQNIAKNWANRNVLPTSLQFDPKSIASQEAFNKQAEQLAQQQFGTIGGTGTDAKFGSAFKSNPNDALSQLGNQGIIRLLKGNEDAIQAKNKAWQSWLAQGKPPQSYQEFAQQFNQNFDPRVYQAQYMSKDDLSKMAKSMSGPEFQAFKAKIAAAKASGYASGPGALYNGQ